MAGKKVPSMEDAINNFLDVMKRSSLKDYVYVNRILLSKNPKGQSILIIPDQELWNKLTENQDFMKTVKEASTDNPDKNLFNYGEDINSDSWFEVDPQAIYSGSIFKITVENFVYELLINKNMIPLKLKKSEVNNIRYRVFASPYVLAIKKKFEFPVDGGSFTIMRLMKIL